MKKVELCIFDMDGLLLDTEKQMWSISQVKAAREQGYDRDPKFFAAVMGGGVENATRILKQLLDGPIDTDLYWSRVAYYNQQFIDSNKKFLMPGVMELLTFLKENGIEMAVATSTEAKVTIPLLKRHEIFDFFSYIKTGDTVKNGKPNPEIYLDVFNHYNYPKENIFIFEDSHNGAQAAVSSGMNLILVPDFALVTDQDRKDAFRVLDKIIQMIDVVKELNN